MDEYKNNQLNEMREKLKKLLPPQTDVDYIILLMYLLGVDVFIKAYNDIDKLVDTDN